MNTVSSVMRAAETYNDLAGLPISLLLKEGEKCLEADSLEERGAAAFNVIVSRYYRNPSDTALRRAATIALRHMGNLNLTHDIDYRKAYRNLHSARQIAEDDKDTYQLAFILNSLASLYSMNIVDNDSIAAIADRLLLQSLQTALESNNEELLPTVGINIAFSNFQNGSWGIFGKDIHRLEKKQFHERNHPGGETVKYVIEATDAFFSKDYAKSERLLLKAKESMPDERFQERYRYVFDLFMMTLYLQASETDKAIATMKKVLAEAREHGNRDYELTMLYQLSKTFDELGIADSVNVYYPQYLKLKDIMRVETGYGEIETLDFLTEIERINKDLEALSINHQKARRRLLVVVFALLTLGVIFLAFIIVHLNLKRTNRNLFLRNEEFMRREEQHRLLRAQLEREKSTQSSQEIAEVSKEPAEDSTDDERNEDTAEEREIQIKLYTAILKVMEEDRAVFESGFSLNNLASLLGVTPRATSRAINICHGSNFHQLLNEYRIREVTRLMHDPANASLTIEGLAEMAGFKSRTSFSRLFKTIIGLTPSDYIRMIREKQKDA